ncbi:MAG: hypothetical protein ACP5VS_05410, partial [Desulfomonilaceae bacterium]
LRENPEDFNYYVQMGDYKPFPLDKAKKAVEILSKAKITDEDIENTAFDQCNFGYQKLPREKQK